MRARGNHLHWQELVINCDFIEVSVPRFTSGIIHAHELENRKPEQIDLNEVSSGSVSSICSHTKFPQKDSLQRNRIAYL